MPIQLGDTTFFSLHELSKKLGLSLPTLRVYIKRGMLAAERVGGGWYVTEGALRDFNELKKKRVEDEVLEAYLKGKNNQTY